MKTTIALGSASLLLLAACSGGDTPSEGGPITLPDPPTPTATEGAALTLTTARGCALTSDCASGETCFQNVCAVAPAASPDVADRIPDLFIETEPPAILRVAPGATQVAVAFTLSAPVPTGGLAYRIERFDTAGEQTTATTRLASGSGTSVTISIDVGEASPDVASPILVPVNIVTAAGTVSVTLAPALTDAGAYGGVAVLSTFGQLGLPIEMSIVTEPVGASLDAATAAYLVLPIEDGNLFNPLPYTPNGPTHVTRALEYDEFVRGWVARFEMPYDVDEAATFGWVVDDGVNSVTRRLRFELMVAGEGQVVGRISDRWSGLFEARSTGGVLQPEDIVFEGDLTLQRIDAAPALEDVPVEPYTTGPTGLLPLPTLGACLGTSLTASVTVDSRSYACGAITTVAQFESAAPAAQAACAIATSRQALASNTTAQQIEAFLDDETPNPGGLSFADFMRQCAAQENGYCVPSAAVLCGRQLTAYALETQPAGGTDGLVLLRTYQDTTREAFLGRQFAAFHADAQTRLDWLKAQDYPAIVTSAVKSLVEGLLDAWRANVLEAHLTVLDGQFDASGGAVLGQQITDPDALDAQRVLLLETTNSWRGAADALALGARRWDTLLTDPGDRAEVATYVYGRIVDLYLIAGVLAEQNRRAGSGGANALFAGGFRPLVRAVRQLAKPFDRLVYDRQGEVVVSTSLDPQSGNTAILSERKDDAMAEVDRASAAVTDVIDRAQAELLQQAELTTRIANEASELEVELAELCGLPDGCTEPDDGACAPRVEAGECGFVTDASGSVLNAFPAETNPSEAGAAILEVRAALLELRRADEALRAHTAQTDLYYATTNAFAQRVNSWNAERASLVSAIQSQITQLQADADGAIALLAANAEAQAAERQSRLDTQESFIDTWDDITVDGIEDDFEKRLLAARIRATGKGIAALAEAIDKKAQAVKDGLPKAVGMTNDPSFAQRLAVGLSSWYITKLMQGAALAAESAATTIERDTNKKEALREADLKVLEFEDALSAAESEAAVEQLRNQAQLIETATELQQGIVREIIVMMQRDTDAALAFERDLVELRDRRDEVFARMIENDGLAIQVLQAEFTVEQALAKYGRAVQRAQLLQGRLVTVRGQLQNINQIVGSPAAVFAWANRLTRAEQRLERAKDKLREWLIALEYYAVRPFFDTRIQILLARNTTQLEAIAAELLRLQNTCGGAQNRQRVEVSVRKDLLDIREPMVDLQSNETIGPEARFVALLERASVAVDKQVRYRTDATIGDLFTRGGVMAVTFDIGLDDFANLGTTCNAKIGSVSVKLVGEGLGDANPTVSLLYDGTSRLRSCQPDIEAIVETVGRDVTPFGEITEFKTPGRSVSPVAGINEFPSSNLTLGGLPLVSEYTLIIDPSAGENSRVDWDALTDVELQIEYTYQDLFPSGQCQ